MKEIRMLVTQDCNYECKMCHGEGLQEEVEATMTPEDMAFVFKVGKEKFGMDTTTLTGGEPLFRKDVVAIAKALYEQGAKITLTTNGRLLSQRMDVGQYLTKVNISFHTTNKEKYEDLVQVPGSYDGALNSIRSFKEKYPWLPMVLNSTCIRGFNSEKEDLANMVLFAKSVNSSIKILELFPSDSPDCVKLGEIREKLVSLGFDKQSSNLRKIIYSDGDTKVILSRIFCSEAVLSGEPDKFCNLNNDLFLSPDGWAKPCRTDEMEVDFNVAIALRNEQEMARKILQAFSLIGDKCSYKNK